MELIHTCYRVLDLDRSHRVALAELGEEALRLPLAVLLDERAGGGQRRQGRPGQHHSGQRVSPRQSQRGAADDGAAEAVEATS